MASNIERACKLIQAKSEVTYRTDPTPALGTDDIYCRMIEYQPNIARAEKPRVGAVPTGLGSELASLSSKIDIEFDFVGMADSPLTVARWTRFLLASGMAVTASGGPPVDTQTFAFSSRTALASLTLYIFMFATGSGTAVQHIVTGARFKFDIEMGVNQVILCKLAGEGYQLSETDATPTLASIAYDASKTDAVAARNVTFTIGGVETRVKKFSLKSNRETNRVDTITDQYAVGKVFNNVPPGKTHEFNIDFEMQLNADYDHWAILKAGTLAAGLIRWDSPGLSRVSIAMAQLRLKDFKHEEDGAIMRINANYEVLDGAGLEDAFTIEFKKTP